MSSATVQFCSPESTPRVAAMLPLGAFLTLALFTLMQSLISQEFTAPPDEPAPTIKPVVLADTPTITNQYERPEPPAPVEETPQAPELTPQVTEHEYKDPGLTVRNNILPRSDELTIGHNNSMLIKQVMVPPVYPRRLLARGIEGFVDVEFSVSAAGATRDIKIVRAEPEGAFEKAAITAVERWRYRPIKVNGEPVASEPIVERIRFSIDK